jgi:UDPglucose 6-dehydrogenase
LKKNYKNIGRIVEYIFGKVAPITGADAKEVERGLKSDMRVGHLAYVSPGLAFAGGTLARDILFLKNIAFKNNFPLKMISSVIQSNNIHKKWIQNKEKSSRIKY